MKLARFILEDWFREHYFDTEIMLCLSGVEEFSLGEIRDITGLSQEKMDHIVLLDSPLKEIQIYGERLPNDGEMEIQKTSSLRMDLAKLCSL